MAFLFTSLVWADGPASIPPRYGLQALANATPAKDFNLPDLAGGRASLSDYHGHWVLLTFFATWCGPCRHEMPSLERLHHERGDDLAILAVSVDSEQAPIRPFVEELGVTFEVLWDEHAEVGRTYRASSIPVSFLIDPSGRIVALAEGARDWSRMTGMVDELVRAVPPDTNATRDYADAGAVEIDAVTEPPTAEVTLEPSSPVAGDVFYLDVRLQWAGDFAQYVPQPPVVHLPEGVKRVAVTASSSSEEGRNVVSYRVALEASTAGEYAVGPVDLRYTTRNASSPQASQVEGTTVVVREAPLLSRSPAVMAAATAGAALAALLAIVAFRRRRHSLSTHTEDGATAYQDLRQRFVIARSKRLEGDTAGFVADVSELLSDLGDVDANRDDDIDELLERVRYGGQSLPAESLDRLQRDVERRLDGLRPDPEKRERETIRLAEEGE